MADSVGSTSGMLQPQACQMFNFGLAHMHQS
jgi:hypothetical protein